MEPIITIIIVILVLILLYFGVYRPWQTTWGATKEEVKRECVGDDIVKKPDFIATRGINIKAPAAEVWRWIIQIGSARAGWYSLDFMDNANKPSSKKILPEFQKIELDYFVPFTPDQKNGMWVKYFRENEYILWWDKKGDATWGWYLYTTDEGSRLITRLRSKYNFSFPWIIYYILYDFGDIVMMSKCMKGIKARAEANVVEA